MSNKRKEEVIKNLTNTIESEKRKDNGGNQELINKLTQTLESIKDGTHVSKFKKKKKK